METQVRVRNSREQASTEHSLGWADAAARIAAWTSRLLVSFLIIAAALVFTSQILHWWHKPEPLPVTASNSPDGDFWKAVEWVDADWTTTLYTASGRRKKSLRIWPGECYRLHGRLPSRRTPRTKRSCPFSAM